MPKTDDILVIGSTRYITVQALSQRTAYTTQHLRLLAKNGELDAIKMGRRLWFPEDCIPQFFKVRSLHRVTIRGKEPQIQNIPRETCVKANPLD